MRWWLAPAWRLALALFFGFLLLVVKLAQKDENAAEPREPARPDEQE